MRRDRLRCVSRYFESRQEGLNTVCQDDVQNRAQSLDERDVRTNCEDVAHIRLLDANCDHSHQHGHNDREASLQSQPEPPSAAIVLLTKYR